MNERFRKLLLTLFIIGILTQVVLAGLGSDEIVGITGGTDNPIGVKLSGNAYDPWYGNPRVAGTMATQGVAVDELNVTTSVTTTTHPDATPDYPVYSSVNNEATTSVSTHCVGPSDYFVSGWVSGGVQDLAHGNWSGSLSFWFSAGEEFLLFPYRR